MSPDMLLAMGLAMGLTGRGIRDVFLLLRNSTMGGNWTGLAQAS